MIKLSTEFLIKKSQGAYGLGILFCLAFFESTILLLPVELIILSIATMSSYRWYIISCVATVGSVLGGISGYYIGAFAWQPIAVPLLQQFTGLKIEIINHRHDILLPEYISQLLNLPDPTYLLALFESWSAWLVVIFAVSPLPYRLITMASGAAGVSLPVFIIASFLARGLRYTLVAWLVQRFSDKAQDSLKKIVLYCTISLLILAIGYILSKIIILNF